VPNGSLLHRLDIGVTLFQSGFVRNPNDASSFNDYRFWGYVLNDAASQVYTAVIGVVPCAPLSLQINGMFAAKYVSTEFDIAPSFERFTNFTTISVFGKRTSIRTTFKITV
jgi:hypothetical protein